MIQLPNISRKTICTALDSNRTNSYYQPKKQAGDQVWLQRITQVLAENPDYGIYRLYLYFKLEGITISQAKIRRICRNNGIQAKINTSQPPKRDKQLPDSKIPNLVKPLLEGEVIEIEGVKRNLPALGVNTPNQVWSGDFSYFKVQGLWYYLATVIDNYTREIVGFSISTSHNTELIIRALNMAIWQNRTPKIFHSDQGSEYTSLQYQKLLTNLNIIQSNANKASPWENGYQESFYGKFKQELRIYRLAYCQNYMEIYNLIATQIDYYNNYRIHTSIRNIPSRFYSQYQELKLNELNEVEKEENYVL